MKGLLALLRALMERHGISPENIVCHRGVLATACPGKLFPIEGQRALDGPLIVLQIGKDTADCQGEKPGQTLPVKVQRVGGHTLRAAKVAHGDAVV